MKIGYLLLLTVFFLGFCLPSGVRAEGEYVGTETCADCHQYEYDNFVEYSTKPHS